MNTVIAWNDNVNCLSKDTTMLGHNTNDLWVNKDIVKDINYFINMSKSIVLAVIL